MIRATGGRRGVAVLLPMKTSEVLDTGRRPDPRSPARILQEGDADRLRAAFTFNRSSSRMSCDILTRSSIGSVGCGFAGCEPGDSRMKNIGTSSSLKTRTRWPFSVTSSSSPSAPSPNTWPKLSFNSASRITYSPSTGKLCVTVVPPRVPSGWPASVWF